MPPSVDQEDLQMAETLKNKYEMLINKASRYKKAYESLTGKQLSWETIEVPEETDLPQQPAKVNGDSHLQTGESNENVISAMKRIITAILTERNELTPLSVLHGLYVKRGGSVTDRKLFGIRMSQLKGKGFQNSTLDDLPVAYRFPWGLEEWFNKEEPKPNYESKYRKTIAEFVEKI